MSVRLTDFTYQGKNLVNDVFIETGTFRGETLFNALRAGFKALYSIEFLEENWRIATKKFNNEAKVKVLLGSSPDILPTIIDQNRATTFWLDAHFQGGSVSEQDPKYGECPLLGELKAIFEFKWEISPWVLIDDAHMFNGNPPGRFKKEQWCNTEQIRCALPSGWHLDIFNNIVYCFR